MPTGNKYKEAGVDIDAGNRLVDKIKPLAAATARKGTMDSIGGFAGLFDVKALGYRDPILVACTDGVGTKLKIAIETNHHDTIGIDLVAMCVNDLVVQGAEPLFFLDYFATGALKVDQAREVIAGIAEGCTQAGCALIGGETAEMPGMYGAEDYDLAGFSVGIVERDGILPRKDALAAGDVILGLASTGVHSNGFSLVRHILKAHHLNLSDAAPFSPGQTYGEALLVPTRIYVKSCMEAIRTGKVKALAHITGGGLIENLPRILPDALGAHIDAKSWERPEVFPWLQAQGSISALEMLRTFNSGIGMVVVVAPEHALPVTDLLTRAGEKVYTIGALKARRHSSVEIGGI